MSHIFHMTTLVIMMMRRPPNTWRFSKIIDHHVFLALESSSICKMTQAWQPLWRVVLFKANTRSQKIRDPCPTYQGSRRTTHISRISEDDPHSQSFRQQPSRSFPWTPITTFLVKEWGASLFYKWSKALSS